MARVEIAIGFAARGWSKRSGGIKEMILLVEGKVFLFFFFKFYKFLYRKIQTVHVFISVQILFCIRGLVITET